MRHPRLASSAPLVAAWAIAGIQAGNVTRALTAMSLTLVSIECLRVVGLNGCPRMINGSGNAPVTPSNESGSVSLMPLPGSGDGL